MVKCPFCDENDFDLEGLKDHFDSGDCDAFNRIKVPVRFFRSKNAQQDRVVDLQTVPGVPAANSAMVPCKDFLPGSKVCRMGFDLTCGERSCLIAAQHR